MEVVSGVMWVEMRIGVFGGRGGRGSYGYWGDAVPPDFPALRGPSERELLRTEYGGVSGYGRRVRTPG